MGDSKGTQSTSQSSPPSSQTQQNVQQTADQWKKLVDEQIGRMTSSWEELARLEAKGAEQARSAIDELARLGKEYLAYSAQIGAEWRKLATDATKLVADRLSAVTPRA